MLNMTGIRLLWQTISADYGAFSAHYPQGFWGRVQVLFLCPCFHAVIHYRVAFYLRRLNRKLLARLISNRMRNKYGIEIHSNAVIGPGLIISHGVGVVIGSSVCIGKSCTIFQGVTVGVARPFANQEQHSPVIGNNVTLGAGAKILGAINVGDGSVIGANAVVIGDVPEYCVVAGVPARILRKL